MQLQSFLRIPAYLYSTKTKQTAGDWCLTFQAHCRTRNLTTRHPSRRGIVGVETKSEGFNAMNKVTWSYVLVKQLQNSERTASSLLDWIQCHIDFVPWNQVTLQRLRFKLWRGTSVGTRQLPWRYTPEKRPDATWGYILKFKTVLIYYWVCQQCPTSFSLSSMWTFCPPLYFIETVYRISCSFSSSFFPLFIFWLWVRSPRSGSMLQDKACWSRKCLRTQANG